MAESPTHPTEIPSNSDEWLALISARAFADEQLCVAPLMHELAPLAAKLEAIFARASALVTRIREAGSKGVEAFLHTYGLQTHEGVAVMCLAEALLRIPDPETANLLIRDKLEHTHWSSYLGSSDSFFVNAASWGLLLTGSVVNLGAMHEEKPASLLGRLVSRAGEPVIREALKQAMRLIGGQFVMGETIEEALKHAHAQEQKGYRFSYDMLGEEARNQQQADEYFASYCHAIKAIVAQKLSGSLFEAPSISVKLSALHPRYHLVKEQRVMDELLPRLRDIIMLAREGGISISIDAEESTRLDLQLRLYRELLRDPAFAGYDGIGFVLQAYQKRGFHILQYLVQLCRETGRRIPLRLVKGAYWDSEIKTAQMQGLPSYPVFTRKEHTDVSYLACAKLILLHPECFYPQFATHNALTVATILELAGEQARGFEFQRLHGMGEHLHDQVVQDIACRIYAPVGRHQDLLAYLIRRLLENGANTSFVHLLMDKETPMEQLLEDPTQQVREQGGTQNENLPNPALLYSDRANSQGMDFGNATMLRELTQGLAQFTIHKRELPDATTKEINEAVTEACTAFPAWQGLKAEQRAMILEKAAELLQAHKHEAVALCVREAGKTLPDAVAEWRESIDFCRYYALHARKLMNEQLLEGPTGERNSLHCTGRGVFVCISPWNFPLAIFMGQVAAALVTGNSVIAKPAQQTPLIAAFAVRLLKQAGVPAPVLQLVTGDGATAGAALTRDERIAGVVFTGSTATAQSINRTLAARSGPIIPFIAETGGQNCMIVDSSALLEQVCDSVIQSAFGSAGQRCSALRVLYVQEEVADKLITLIAGAMEELRIGDPADPATDIGPVIDAAARDHLLTHIARMTLSAKLLAATPLPADVAQSGTFVAPHAFEIASLKALPQEVFGPVLHVIRYKAAELEQVCAEINSTGYGLTFGLQSRIEANVQLVAKHIRAGNIYINRSMTGAIVGVQPFGGEGLSGTGPKAGGPHYLTRFVTERTLTINTAAMGGNIDLLSRREH